MESRTHTAEDFDISPNTLSGSRLYINKDEDILRWLKNILVPLSLKCMSEK